MRVYSINVINIKRSSRWITRYLLCLLFSSAIAFEEDGYKTISQLMIPFLEQETQEQLKQWYGEHWQQGIIMSSTRVHQLLERPKYRYLLVYQQTLFDLNDDQFIPEKHCPKNQCSVGAILEAQRILQDPNQSTLEKKKALSYLIHYTLQLHIPINCGLKRDQGGQKIFLKDDELKPVNFAWIWNHDLYRQQNKRWFGYARELFRLSKEMDITAWQSNIKISDWALESKKIAVETLYPLATQGRYNATIKKEGKEIIEQQMIKASIRIAALLNALYASSKDTHDLDHS